MSTPSARVLWAVLLVACADSNPSPSPSVGGTLVIATTTDPSLIFPPLIVSLAGRQVAEQIYDYLIVVGPEMNTFGDSGFRPRLAESWRWSPDSLSIAFKVNRKARWHDGVPADASDVRFTFKIYTDRQLSSPDAEELSNIDSVTTADSLTAIVWYHSRSSHQLLDASQMMILPRHILEKIPVDSLREAGARLNPVGTGRFRLHSWTRSSSLELTADTTNYRGRPGLNRVIWTVVPNSVTAVMKLFGGEADVFEPMKPANVAELTKHPDLHLQSIPGTDYVFLGFNLQDPKRPTRQHSLFASRELRRALTMAVDRTSLVKNTFDTLAVVALGPTVRVFPTTDTTLTQIPFDPRRAKAVLDSLGWRDTTAQGIRKREGQELAFTAMVPSSSQSRVRMAVLIQEELRRIGVRMNIDQMDFNTFQTRLQSRDFEAAFWNWHLGATPNSLREAWGGQSARSKGGINYAAYDNPRFDGYVDSAISAMTIADSKRYFTAAYQIIIGDAPAIWLYEPKTVIGLHRRIRTGTMRPDAWWFDLGSWFIPRSDQIGRDRVPINR
jgi:peptide/nickel transport system substrate-binding protein